ncbi:MAG: hypothetical protein K0U52_06545 [Gammaproteobacteria bacterium]|nr:hypothetical protein [Gammaproteobacteria bacterium]
MDAAETIHIFCGTIDNITMEDVPLSSEPIPSLIQKTKTSPVFHPRFRLCADDFYNNEDEDDHNRNNPHYQKLFHFFRSGLETKIGVSCLQGFQPDRYNLDEQAHELMDALVGLVNPADLE